MPPRIILATTGSLGDLHPFLALGEALAARGASIVVASAAEYRSKVERAGLAFRAVRPSFGDLQRELAVDRGELTRLILERTDFLLRRVIMPHIGVAYDDMREIVFGADLVLNSSLAFGARLAAEKARVPWVAVVLQPLMFLSAFDPPVLPKVQWLTPVLRRLGPAVTGALLGGLKAALNAQLGPLQALRLRIGLEPARQNALFEGQFGPGGALALYSPLLAGPQPDHPRPTLIAGFTSFDSADGGPATLDCALEAFLQEGDPPLVFTLGSLIVNSPGGFYRESLAAAGRLGKRAVLLVGENAAAAHAVADAPDVHVAEYAPHSLLFPRALAIVHHGGMGTLAQALRSGRPQLIVPFYADQVDNAARAVRIGVAQSVAPARYTAELGAAALAALIRLPQYAAGAALAAAHLKREDGAARAAEWLMNRLESPDGALAILRTG